MVGSAVPTMVWSSAASSRASIRPEKTIMIWRCVSTSPGA